MPLISVSGTQCIGKSTFIQDFIAQWPMYKTSSKSYRDIIKDKNLSINKETTKESQQVILESIVEDIENAKKDEYWIFDRSPIDNLVYSLWSYDKNKSNIDDAFIADCIKIARLAIQKLNLMLFIPISKQNDIALVKDDLRDVDPIYRKEIDELFQGLKRKREGGDDVFFVKDDSPPIIEVFGGRSERIAICQLYIKENGDFFGEEESLLFDANGDYINADSAKEIDTGERDQLRRHLGLDKKIKL